MAGDRGGVSAAWPKELNRANHQRHVAMATRDRVVFILYLCWVADASRTRMGLPMLKSFVMPFYYKFFDLSARGRLSHMESLMEKDDLDENFLALMDPIRRELEVYC